MLIQKGEAVDAQNEGQGTPLHLAASGCVRANVDALEVKQFTPLNLAAFWGHVKAAWMLIQMIATVDACNKYQQTPLHHAASRGLLL